MDKSLPRQSPVERTDEQSPKRNRTEDATATNSLRGVHVPLDDVAAVALERRHVHDVYSKIATHFSSTRYKPWPQVADFVQSLAPGSIMVDVGSGNGKNLGIASHVTAIGCDVTTELLALGRARGLEGLRCDGIRTPFRTGVADAVISIAVLHHFATPARRLCALNELVRIVKPGGRLLIYVWAIEQAKDRGGSDVLIDWEVHEKYDKAQPVLRRYYHLFRQGELEQLVEQVPGVAVARSYFDKENWVVELHKAAAASAAEDVRDSPPSDT
jgi:tRNA (uracil-5-)-methyltransferase TRM9